MLSEDAKAAVVLTTRLGSRQRPSLTPQRWHRFVVALADSGYRPADVFDMDTTSLEGLEAGTADRVRELLSDRAAVAAEAEDLERQGIWILTIADNDYPDHLQTCLGATAPPVLFGAGGRSSLSEQGVGIVGSREAGGAAAAVASEIAKRSVELGRSVISGGARGIDQLAMRAAFSAGGTVVGVLADSLLSRIRKQDIVEAIHTGAVCLVTEQAPSTGFSPASAMARNRVIYALSQVTVVVRSDMETGGTWAGAIDALRLGNSTVAVWRGDGEGPGNIELERRGAVAFTNPDELAALLTLKRPEKPDQLSLT